MLCVRFDVTGSILRLIGAYFQFCRCWLGGIFIFFLILKEHSLSKQTLHYAVSDLDLHCLLKSHQKGARLIWVNTSNDKILHKLGNILSVIKWKNWHMLFSLI